jgi:hypothetical protein
VSDVLAAQWLDVKPRPTHAVRSFVGAIGEQGS